jgi:hypothetical protein
MGGLRPNGNWVKELAAAPVQDGFKLAIPSRETDCAGEKHMGIGRQIRKRGAT